MSNSIFHVKITGGFTRANFTELREAVEHWAAYRVEGAWIEQVTTSRLIGHEELSDEGAESLAKRVLESKGHGGQLIMAAMPRLGEYRADIFQTINKESRS